MTDMDYNKEDKASLSNYQSVLCEHMHFDWNVDFENKQLSGCVTHSMKVMKESNVVELDTSKIIVSAVSVNEHDVKFQIAEAVGALGNKLSIDVPTQCQKEGTTLKVCIKYCCHAEASAIQWLDAAATKGGKFPYIFTQCQAIHARSLFPCQDTPGVKTTYSAIVQSPSWCTVLMSAVSEPSLLKEHGVVAAAGKAAFGWKQPVPMPAYLVALAAGNLKSVELSPRVKVWSEPELVDAAASDFSQTEEFLQTAEDLTCPYVWGRYDILCLPPSFPYGGMENPCLTFATPTLLTGDKSLADVIAHEISHSWTGNLVTNATWEHFWLNEGWTVWLERKIAARFRGSDDYRKLSAQGGYKGMKDDVAAFGVQHPFTRLVRGPSQDDPDEAFSRIPYEKGFNLLYYLENLVGSSAFESFAKAYIQKFKFKTVTSGEFRDCFVQFIESENLSPLSGANGGVTSVSNIDWDELFHSPGMPRHAAPDFSNSLSVDAEKLAESWIQYTKATAVFSTVSASASASTCPLPETLTEKWNTQQISVFLDSLIEHSKEYSPLPEAVLVKMEECYKFNGSQNAEIRLRWYSLCLLSQVQWIVPGVIDLLTSQGRMKYLRPLYKALNGCVLLDGHAVAVKTFLKHQSSYHPIARKMVGSDIGAHEPPTETQTTPPAVTESAKTSSTKKDNCECNYLWHAAAAVALIGVAFFVAKGLSKRR